MYTFLHAHNDRWAKNPENRIGKLWFDRIDIKRSKQLLSFSKNQLRVLMQVLTGHNDLNYFLHKLGLVESPMCLCGMREETVEHVVGECLMYIERRKRILNQFVISPTNFSSLNFKKLLKFLGETERFG